MRKLAVLAALLAPLTAAARPTLAARVAIAPAVGSVASNVPMGDVLQVQLPLQLDALWREGALALGAYGSFGIGWPSAAVCAEGAECSGAALRLGLQGTWALPPPPRWPQPWLGAGVGWERASFRRERLGSASSWRYGGAEAFLQGGVEWSLGGRFALGPYALVALGRYGSASLETPVASASADLVDRAFHAWFHLGVRGRVDL
jgi:hypothetical protein